MVTEITKILVASVNFSIDDVRHPSIILTLIQGDPNDKALVWWIRYISKYKCEYSS